MQKDGKTGSRNEMSSNIILLVLAQLNILFIPAGGNGEMAEWSKAPSC
ncbi:MAG: hypothetical protein LBE98_00325 [Puniceicoccales bacterium]|nr:hypothetical protein [Puniceicoccales bacterium]